MTRPLFHLPFVARVVLGIILSASAAFAHPIHSSLAEADYNRANKKLEVALRVFVDDFEAALSARAKTKISLEKTPRAELDALTRAYVAERFTVQAPAGQPVALEWVGRDLKDAANELWLFFEFTLPAGIEGATLHHAVLSEHFGDQINTLQIRDGEQKATLVFLSRHTAKRVRFRP